MSEKLNLLQRLAAVQGEIDYIQREKRSGMNYSIVSHDAVTAAVRPLMVKHGVLYYVTNIEVVQDGNRTQAKMEITFANIDNPDDCIITQSIGYGIDAQDKGPGKAMSYCVKYALLKTLGLETGDDPDLDQNAKHEPAKTVAKTLTKTEARPEYATISAGIKTVIKTGGVDDLSSWWTKNVATIKTFTPDWKQQITKEFDDARDELSKVPA